VENESVGGVLGRLDRRGLAEQIVVVFVSDSGGYISKIDNVSVTSNFPLWSSKGSTCEKAKFG
jgi:hypothetical protein